MHGEIFDASFTRDYGAWLLGEIKEQFSFFYAKKDFDYLIQFFQYLNGYVSFDYPRYQVAYKDFVEKLDSSASGRPAFVTGEGEFLQLLYDLNIIGYREKSEAGTNFYRWCYRERTISNLRPKVKSNANFQVAPGISKQLDLGKHFDS